MIRNDIERGTNTLAHIRELYRRQDRIEPCACGGTIRLRGDAQHMLATVMRVHQATFEHRLWRESQ